MEATKTEELIQQSAGKYIGEGAYGCVFKPHLRCNRLKNIKNSVGKVFNNRDHYEEEENITKQVLKLDPKNEFTVPILATCAEVKLFRQSDDVHKCEFITPTHEPSQSQQIIYKYGGKSLQDMMSTKNGSIAAFVKLFVSMGPLIKGLQTFAEKNITHMDIKPPNLLVNKNRLYLIDFGLTSKHSEIFTTDMTNILRTDYLWFPPEFKAFLLPASSSIDVLYRRFMDNFAENDPSVGRALRTLLQVNVRKELQELWSDKPAKKSYVQSAAMIDVYSLGIVLLQLLLWSGYHLKEYKRASPYSVLRDQIIEMLKGMLRMDPKKRSSIKAVLQQYTEIMKLNACLKRKTADVKASPGFGNIRPKTKVSLCLAKTRT